LSIAWLALLAATSAGQVANLSYSKSGVFENHADVGVVQRPGSVVFDPERNEYQVTGGGENMWGTTDAFHFVWRRMSGDFALTADVRFVGTGGNPHRKAGWIVRQTLEPGSPYADAVVHGDGLTSLQFREVAGGITREVKARVTSPTTIRLERRGNTFTMSAARAGDPLQIACSTTLSLRDPVYVGLAVCAHDAKAEEKAIFSRVAARPASDSARGQREIESILETVSVETGERKTVDRARRRAVASNAPLNSADDARRKLQFRLWRWE
jgi:regulation of enolase protein 1 (concanavalin A-like superfamily)